MNRCRRISSGSASAAKITNSAVPAHAMPLMPLMWSLMVSDGFLDVSLSVKLCDPTSVQGLGGLVRPLLQLLIVGRLLPQSKPFFRQLGSRVAPSPGWSRSGLPVRLSSKQKACQPWPKGKPWDLPLPPLPCSESTRRTEPLMSAECLGCFTLRSITLRRPFLYCFQA